MTTPNRTDEFATVDGTEIHYSAWGAADAPPVVCVHGLSRVGRDFDPLARALADDYRVLCPDLPGRGWSGWAGDDDDPAAFYSNASLAAACAGFVDELGLDELRWVGTSLGGVLGARLAGGPLVDRITHLVMNDVSPDPAADADPAALERIATYVPDPPVVDAVSELEDYYREVYGGRFSEMTDAEWRRFTVTSARRRDDGRVTRAYDPRIAAPMRREAEASGEASRESEETDEESGDEPSPYDRWADVAADLLVVRGADSGILTAAARDRMLERQPTAETVTVDSGHAPALNTPEQIDPIREFLAD